MKRTLIILTLAALLVLPLIIAGCSCGGGTTLTESDIATLKGFGARMDSHDSSIATINATLENLDTETLNALAALDADELAVLMDLDLSTALTDIGTLKNDMSTLKATTIPGLDTRLTDLEDEESNPGGTVASGEVTVTLGLGEGEEAVQFISGSSPASQVFPVKITNGTSEYKQVTYNVTLRCISSDYTADVAGGYSMTVNTVAMGATSVPDDPGCQWIYFLWIDPGRIPLAPGAATVAYTTLNDFATSSGYEVWEVTLSGISVTEL